MGKLVLNFSIYSLQFPPPKKNYNCFLGGLFVGRRDRVAAGLWRLGARPGEAEREAQGLHHKGEARRQFDTTITQSHNFFFCSYQDFISAVTPGRLSGLKEAFRLDMEMFGYGDEDTEFGGGGGGG